MSRSGFPQTVQPTVHKKQYDLHAVWVFENDWHSQLCSCKPMGRCCFACFCSCCMGYKLAKHLGETSIIGCFPCSLSYLRTKLRTSRRIKGSCCGDFCAPNCCAACTEVQMANELESQGMWDILTAQKSKNDQQDRSNPYNDHH